jgi:very-long-chain (3R)-3-hydroxyacyl-CoA dehydratase
MVKRWYLSLFNLLSLLGWEFILLRLLRDVSFWSSSQLGFRDNFDKFLLSLSLAFKATADLLPLVQSLAILELLHSAVGWVRAPVKTTAIQIASRLLLVWGVVWWFGGSRYELFTSPAYFTMVLSWSITEIIRYGYYLASLMDNSGAPALLTWLRYSLFFVLYPVGAASEAFLLYLTAPFTKKYFFYGPFFIYGILVIYLPGMIF